MSLKKPADAENKPEVEVIASETVDTTSQKEVIIDTTTGKPAEKSQTSTNVDPSEIERKLSARFNYELRQLQKQNKELAERLNSMNQVRPAKAEERLDDFDAEVERVAQTDWRKAVDMRAERIAKKLAEDQIKAYQEQQKKEFEEKTFKENIALQDQKSKQKVLQEFPDLVDENSEITKKYMGVWNREIADDPYFLNNPRKYEIVAAQIRDEARQHVNPEVERQRRVASTSNNSSRSVQSGNRITLTQEEIDFCDRSGIPYASFSASKKAMKDGTFKEGLELKS